MERVYYEPDVKTPHRFMMVCPRKGEVFERDARGEISDLTFLWVVVPSLAWLETFAGDMRRAADAFADVIDRLHAGAMSLTPEAARTIFESCGLTYGGSVFAPTRQAPTQKEATHGPS